MSYTTFLFLFLSDHENMIVPSDNKFQTQDPPTNKTRGRVAVVPKFFFFDLIKE